MKWKFDCRFFRGDKPCRYKRICEESDKEECPRYKPRGKKILIIKLAAIGDVLRTTPVLSALKKKYPLSYLTWLSEEKSLPLLENNPFIDCLLPYNLSSCLQLQVEKFDLLLSLDKDPGGAALATLVRAKKKQGFGWGESGTVHPLNKEAEPAFRLGLDDELKFRKNRKTYQETIFELAGLPYRGEEYLLNLPEEDRDYARRFFKREGIRKSELVIGLNTGAGAVFLTKKWSESGFAELAGRLSTKLGARLLLLGGKSEKELNRRIARRAKVPLIDTGPDNTLLQFTALIDSCSLIVTGDTLALHLAIARKVPAVAIFSSPCPQEIDLYGRGKKLISPVDCAPCYRNSCPEMTCMKKITPAKVFRAVEEIVTRTG